VAVTADKVTRPAAPADNMAEVVVAKVELVAVAAESLVKAWQDKDTAVVPVLPLVAPTI